MTNTEKQAAEALISVGRWLSDRDLVPATSGNFSARLNAEQALLTRSGFDKGELTPEHFQAVDIHAPAPPETSAETALHLALYQRHPHIECVLHTHSLAASVMSRRYEDKGGLTFEGWEMQKAFVGQTTHAESVTVPIFPNTQDIDALAVDVEAAGAMDGPTPGFLLSGHGLYAWGASVAETRRHITAFEFLLSCELERERAQP